MRNSLRNCEQKWLFCVVPFDSGWAGNPSFSYNLHGHSISFMLIKLAFNIAFSLRPFVNLYNLTQKKMNWWKPIVPKEAIFYVVWRKRETLILYLLLSSKLETKIIFDMIISMCKADEGA